MITSSHTNGAHHEKTKSLYKDSIHRNCFTDSEKQHIFVAENIANDIRLWHMSIFIMQMRIINNTYCFSGLKTEADIFLAS